jgi:hypothetical protein
MKKAIVFISVLALILGIGATAMAAPVTFSFDSLADGANATTISAYMTTVYGATVTVSGGTPMAEGSGSFPGLLGGTGDRYIESEPSGDQLITITFAAPITSVSFDWGKALDPFNADFSVDGTTFANFFHVDYTFFSQIGHLNTYAFASPVLALRFHDEGFGEVGIDNLVVDKASVPEPMSLLLLGLGLLGIGVVRRKK